MDIIQGCIPDEWYVITLDTLNHVGKLSQRQHTDQLQLETVSHAGSIPAAKMVNLKNIIPAEHQHFNSVIMTMLAC